MDCRPVRFGRPRTLLCVVATLASALTVLVPLAGSASADPLSSARARAAALAQKISAEQSQVEDLSNQYDAAQYHLSQVQGQVSTARRQLAAASARARRIRGQVTDEAVHEYTTGGFVPQAGRTSVDPLVAQSYFQVATGTQTDALDQYRQAQRALADQQRQLNQAEKAAAAAANTLGDRRQQVVAAQSQAQSTLNGVNGQIATLVAQAQAAAAAKLKAEQEAAFAAQQAIAARQRAAAATAAAAAKQAVAAQAAQAQSGLEAAAATSSSTAAALGATNPAPSAPPTTAAPAPALLPILSAPPSGNAQQTAVAVALQQVGKPYQWGAAGPGSFDCSGLVMYAYGAAGISLPHYTGAQWSDTTQIPLADAQPGDLIFFNGLQHVGIYLGNGTMVDAPHTGADVRVESIFGFGSIDGATRVG